MNEKLRKCCGCIRLPYLHESADGRYRYQCRCGYNSGGRLYICTDGARNSWNRSYAQSEATVLRATVKTQAEALKQSQSRADSLAVELVEACDDTKALSEQLAHENGLLPAMYRGYTKATAILEREKARK